MDAGITEPDRARRRGILVAGAGVLALAAFSGLIASGASASPTRSPEPTAAPAVGIEAIWSETDPATRHAMCTHHLADPDGAWQVLAPVLTANGADRASTQALLDRECAGAITVADLRG